MFLIGPQVKKKLHLIISVYSRIISKDLNTDKWRHFGKHFFTTLRLLTEVMKVRCLKITGKLLSRVAWLTVNAQ